jgi:valyl-tRNA synthetase
MDKTYLHQQHEATVAEIWREHDAFNPDTVSVFKKKHNIPTVDKTFSIIMPPPNANDPLHIGHAMFVALEDVMIRFHRMLGEDTLWAPGTDHAGIETQFVFEKKLKKNNQSRFQFDRETLYKMIWDYVQENSDIAKNQLVKMGASADWSRFTFMLDPKVVEIVLQTFVQLHKKGLVYRDYKLVNYCTKCGTAFSELEVVHVERIDPLYYMKYGPFTISTVRPETKFRDTALAVNPTDPRYQEWLGKTLEIPGLLGPITMKVIADEGVDPEFGTGIMKVTPAHDHHDFELGKQYDLPVTPIITLEGRMDFSWFFEKSEKETVEAKYLERAHKYHGKKVAEARKLMVEDLIEDGLLIKTDDKYTHSVGTCYRCGTIIEPLPLPQFFVSVKPLTEEVLTAIDQGKVRVIGAGHDKILRHWLENLKDWNISRQIVWGIRIPVWYSVTENPTLEVHFTNEGQRISGPIHKVLKTYSLDHIKTTLQELRPPMDANFVVSQESPGEDYLQETDTFDTWFSSAQWPYSILEANQPGDFQRFYPTQVMETGYDILPFWVMRMLMMGLFKTGEVPFSTVYMHGLVRDQKGQKMSKSKGNVINPLTVIDQYGADALRMALVIRSTPGLDKSVGDPDFKAMRNFTNKIWNATRFVKEGIRPTEGNATTKNSQDKEFLARLDQIVAQITQHLKDFKLGLAAETLHNEFWHWFCDICIEESKNGNISQENLGKGLVQFIKLLHPFMPYVTEAVWQELRQDKQFATLLKKESEALVLANWPAS